MAFYGKDCIFHAEVNTLFSKQRIRFPFSLNVVFKFKISTSSVMWDELWGALSLKVNLHCTEEYRREICTLYWESLKCNQETTQMLWGCFWTSDTYSVHSLSSSSGVSLGKFNFSIFKSAEAEKAKLTILSREHICLHNYFRKTFDRFCAVFNFLFRKKSCLEKLPKWHMTQWQEKNRTLFFSQLGPQNNKILA